MNKKEKEEAYERVNGLGLPAWENPETGVLETRPEFANAEGERVEAAAVDPRVEVDSPPAAKAK